MSANDPERLLDLAVLDEGQGPARCIKRAEAEALVRDALRRARIPTAGLRPHTRPAQRRLGIGRRVLFGAGILAATTAAAAFGTSAGRGWLARWTGADAGTHAARPAAPVATTQDMPRPPAQSSVEEASEPAVDVSLDCNPVEPAPAAKRSTSSLRQLPVTPSDLQQTPADTEPSDQAVDLLALANDYRRQKRYRLALETYQQVAEHYPNGRQAEAARVAAAALKLEHLDDAEGAASEYRASAARRGQLSEEAAYGLAEAHRASGRRDLEKTQLERFIASYPRSPLVAAARRRLVELEDNERR